MKALLLIVVINTQPRRPGATLSLEERTHRQGSCSVTLVQHQSRAPCLPGVSFGCFGREQRFWVRQCRGLFHCNGMSTAVRCGYPAGAGFYNCSCRRSYLAESLAVDGESTALGLERSRLSDSGFLALRASLDGETARRRRNASVSAVHKTDNSGSISPRASSKAKNSNTSVLLGILSGSVPRRQAARQILGPARASTPSVRVLFVVGISQPSLRAIAEPDVLQVNISDGAAASSKGSFTVGGSGTVIIKQAEFLRHAVHQPERIIALGEDDTYIALPMLSAIAGKLASLSAPWHAGFYEWYNFVPHELRATGFGGPGRPTAARYYGTQLANCSAGPYDSERDSPKRCVGPLMFPKGPLHFFPRSVAKRIVRSAPFDASLARAHALKRVSYTPANDVLFGYLLAVLEPRLEYIWLGNMGWHDHRGGGAWRVPLDGRSLIAAHRLPFTCWREAEEVIQAVGHNRHEYTLSLPHSPLDHSTREEQFWVHPRTQTSRALVPPREEASAQLSYVAHCNESQLLGPYGIHRSS